MCSSGKQGHKFIGCAIFSRPSKLQLISSKRVHLKDHNALQLESCRSHSFVVDVKSKWNSLVMMEVKVIATNQTLVVANTHIYWNPFRPDIKTFQVAAAMDAIQTFVKEARYV